MRMLKFGHKTAELTEKQVRELIQFFNPRHAFFHEHVTVPEYIIKRRCSLCGPVEVYSSPDCDECPIGKAFGEHGCGRILTKVGSRNRWNFSYIDSTEISWSPANDKLARAMLGRIRTYLKELPRA